MGCTKCNATGTYVVDGEEHICEVCYPSGLKQMLEDLGVIEISKEEMENYEEVKDQYGNTHLVVKKKV